MIAKLPAYKVCAQSGDLGPGGFLKLHGYHQLIFDVVEQEQRANGCPIEETLKHGYAWAVVSISMQVSRPVSSCSWMNGQTWLSKAKYPYFRREVRISDDADNEVLSATLFTVPLSVAEHRLLSAELLPEEFSEQPFGVGVDWAQLHVRTCGEYTQLYSRRIFPSEIDALGHLNNCRYGAYVYDAAVACGKDFCTGRFRYAVNFIKQYLPDSTAEIYYGEDSGQFNVYGTSPESGKKNFTAFLAEY